MDGSFHESFVRRREASRRPQDSHKARNGTSLLRTVLFAHLPLAEVGAPSSGRGRGAGEGHLTEPVAFFLSSGLLLSEPALVRYFSAEPRLVLTLK
ncbi:hypothetical protein KM043_006511 [Ampulex compressa]|nr:hypothetical protein KM043_006511 [Ampulex compressa]